ncbi:helix-turn-helix domain-containing protein [Caldicellulosiruptoraceae bacterium PP1]
MRISLSTLYEWKNKFSEISESLKKGKEVVDREVENALLKATLGYEYEEEIVNNKGQIVRVKKHAKPDITAIIFWLKNRKPDTWHDKQEFNIKSNIGVQIIDDIGSDSDDNSTEAD